MKARILLLAVIMAASLRLMAAEPALVLQKDRVQIVVGNDESSPVMLAVQALCRDFGKVMGFSPSVVRAGESAAPADGVQIVVVDDAAPSSAQLLGTAQTLSGFESHRVSCHAAQSGVLLALLYEMVKPVCETIISPFLVAGSS